MTKQKDGKNAAQRAFRLRVVDLGVDDDGDRVTSCVVDEGRGETPLDDTLQLSGNNLLAMKALSRAIAENGVYPGRDLPRDVRAVDRDGLKRVFKKLYLNFHDRQDLNDDALRQAIYRSANYLREKRLIVHHSPYLWFTTKGMTWCEHNRRLIAD